MHPSYVTRQAITAALTANALRPSSNYYLGAYGFMPGWLTAELAPQLLTFTALDGLRELTHGRQASRLGLALGAASALGLASVIRESGRAGDVVEAALQEGLGTDYRRQLEEVQGDLESVTPWKTLALPFRMRNPAVEIIRDVRYSRYGRRGLLDIYRPKNPTTVPAPVLLQVHGGAWYVGAKNQQGVPLMLQMASAGWICVAINYRLSPRAVWPDHVVDVKKAIAWVREHGPEYGADPSFLAITGGSAGGHLAALAALTPNDPEYQPGFEGADTTLQACVPHYGVYDVAGATGRTRAVILRDRFFAPRVARTSFHDDPELFEKASPYVRVNADAPPFLVIHGLNDSLVSVDQARDFVRALREVSKEPVIYTELSGTQHAFDIFPSIRSQAVMRAVDRFLRWSYADATKHQ